MRYRVIVPFNIEQSYLIDALDEERAVQGIAEGNGCLECAALIEPGDALSVEFWRVEPLEDEGMDE